MILVVLIVLLIFFLLIKGNKKESFRNRNMKAPGIGYPLRGGNMLQGSVRRNGKIVGDVDCSMVSEDEQCWCAADDDLCKMCGLGGKCQKFASDQLADFCRHPDKSSLDKISKCPTCSQYVLMPECYNS